MCFIWTVLTIEGNGYGLSFGRVDQYLYPFYKRDLEAGRLTADEARSLIALFYIKVNGAVTVTDKVAATVFAGYLQAVNITLGGVTPERARRRERPDLPVPRSRPGLAAAPERYGHQGQQEEPRRVRDEGVRGRQDASGQDQVRGRRSRHTPAAQRRVSRSTTPGITSSPGATAHPSPAARSTSPEACSTLD